MFIVFLKVGALTVKQRGRINPLDGDLTFVGRVLATLPCDVRIGKMLILGHVFGCLNECLIIGMFIHSYLYFTVMFSYSVVAVKYNFTLRILHAF